MQSIVEYVVVESALGPAGAVVGARQLSAFRNRSEAEAHIELLNRQPPSDECYYIYSIETRRVNADG